MKRCGRKKRPDLSLRIARLGREERHPLWRSPLTYTQSWRLAQTLDRTLSPRQAAVRTLSLASRRQSEDGRVVVAHSSPDDRFPAAHVL
eukprot:scaffold41173_cov41-Tisochrysis_lutea.AAC.1